MKRGLKNIFWKFIEILNYLTSLGGRAGIISTRFLRFGTSGSFTLIIDILLLAFFVEIIGIYYLFAVTMSFTISTSINYFISRNWGFKGTLTGVLKGYTYFLFFSMLGIAITVFLMWIFVGIFLFYYILARVIVAIIGGTIAFIVNSIFTFKMPSPSRLYPSLALKDSEFEKGMIG